MEDLGIPSLTSEQAEKLCTIAEESARRYLLAKVPKKRIEKLNVSSEVERAKPVRLEISVDVNLLPTVENLDVQELVDEAVREGFKSHPRTFQRTHRTSGNTYVFRMTL